MTKPPFLAALEAVLAECGGRVPRPGQVSLMENLAGTWGTADVFVVRAPVGFGKSAVAAGILRALGGGTVATPTRILTSQYRDDYPWLTPAPVAGSFDRSTPAGRAEWGAARAAFQASGVSRICNYYSYLSHRAYAPAVVFDEAHRLVPMLQDMEAVKLWDNEYPLPPWVVDTPSLLAWAAPAAAAGDRKLAALVRRLERQPDTYTLSLEWDTWRGRDMRCLKLLPLTPRHNRPILWPARVRKLVLMSATLHEEDLYDLGLDQRRVAYIDCESPIPADCRPVVYDPVGSMAFSAQAATFPALVARLRALLARHPGQRGVIHATYSVAARLREALDSEPRLLWHDAATAASTYRRWLASSAPDSVLVASGMSEGIDLVGDRARWQVITQIGYPSKADPAILAKLAVRPAWYAWSAARDVQQAAGRVCRGPDDFGVTYILPTEWPALYTNNTGMFVPSFTESLCTATRSS